MAIRWCVAYLNDLRGTLTFDLKVVVFREVVVQMAALRGDISFRYLKQFFLVQIILIIFLLFWTKVQN
jgi:hypothetical protein